MAELLNEDFEGGSDETAITSGNTDFDSINNTGSASYAFDSGVALFGSLSGRHIVTTSGENSNWREDITADTELWLRYVFQVDDATPASNTQILRFFDNTSLCADVGLTSGGNIRARDSGSTTRYTSTLTVSNDTPVRIVPHFVFSATVGHLEVDIYVGANVDGATPDETIGNQTDNWNTGTQCDNVRGGIVSTAGQALTLWDDAIVLDDAQDPGQVASGPAFPDAPTNLVATTFDDDQIDLAWDAVTGGDGTYDIRRSVGGTLVFAGPLLVAGHGTNSYSDTGLDPGTEYSYTVRAN